jgi:hypothetical protein
MNIREFIRQNRASIDDAVHRVGGECTNDDEREEWILNDEGLYLWARADGVRI